MKFEYFLSKRFFDKKNKGFSKPLIKIAIASIMLGVAVMVISVSVLRGFQKEIRQKIVGFGSHIIVTKMSAGSASEITPIVKDEKIVEKLNQIKGITHIQPYAYKGALIKTDDQIEGILYKGIDKDFDFSFFEDNLKAGNLFHLNDSVTSNDIIISNRLAGRLKIREGDKLRTFFFSDTTYRVRAFNVTGIYETGLSEFDEKIVIGDLRHIQRINNWESDEAQGLEILIDDFSNLDRIAYEVYENTDYDVDISTIKQNEPGLFAWLDLLNTNVIVILFVMALVATASIISTLLVMIFEKASMIGILKTLGGADKLIRKIFMIQASQIIGKGVLYGTVFAFVICWLQFQFKIIRLNPESYSMDYVPIDLNIWMFLLVAVVAFIVCMIALLIPTNVISKISPAKTLRFE